MSVEIGPEYVSHKLCSFSFSDLTTFPKRLKNICVLRRLCCDVNVLRSKPLQHFARYVGEVR